MVKVYIPILVLALLGLGFAAFSVAMGTFVAGPKRWNKAKMEAYECGIEPTPIPFGGVKIPVKYYLTAMLFIVFDIEIIFLYPWAVTFNKLGTFPYTPAMNLLRGLREAIAMLEEEGLENVFARHRRYSAATRAAINSFRLRTAASRATENVIVPVTPMIPLARTNTCISLADDPAFPSAAAGPSAAAAAEAAAAAAVLASSSSSCLAAAARASRQAPIWLLRLWLGTTRAPLTYPWSLPVMGEL